MICKFDGLRTAHRKTQKAIWALENSSAAHTFDYIMLRVNTGLISCEDLATALYTHAMQHGCTIILIVLTTPSHAGWDSTGYKLATFEHVHCSVHPVANVSFIDLIHSKVWYQCSYSCMCSLIYQLHAHNNNCVYIIGNVMNLQWKLPHIHLMGKDIQQNSATPCMWLLRVFYTICMAQNV